MPDNILSCNLTSYRKFRPKEADTRAYEHLQSIGIKSVEIPTPAKEDIDPVIKQLKQFSLSAKTVIAKCDLSQPDVAQSFRHQVEVAQRMGVGLVFVSVKAGDMPRTVAYGRLREVGEVCASHNITLCLETHPDLAHNRDEALKTMLGVNHPNVRLNFDTGNVYYYNHGVTATGELEKIKNCVAAVHLKDTDGGFESWHFPALGEGVVDFAGVFKTLNDIGFFGPFTLELEGIKGEELDFEQTCARVEKSVEHLRELGLVE